MNKKAVSYVGMALLFIIGIYFRHFAGGILVGFSLSLVVLVVIGQKLSKKAVTMLNKRIRDIIIANRN